MLGGGMATNTVMIDKALAFTAHMKHMPASLVELITIDGSDESVEWLDELIVIYEMGESKNDLPGNIHDCVVDTHVTVGNSDFPCVAMITDYEPAEDATRDSPGAPEHIEFLLYREDGASYDWLSEMMGQACKQRIESELSRDIARMKRKEGGSHA
jgi:hypothetical protein